MKHFLSYILRPRLKVIILLAPLSAAFTISVFAAHIEATAAGIVSHVLAAYVLSVVIINIRRLAAAARWFISHSRPSSAVRSAIYKNKYTALYMKDKEYRARVALFSALVINVLFAAAKLAGGIYYESVWYGADAFFYIVLSSANFIILRFMRKNDRSGEPDDPVAEQKLYRLCGIFLLALVAALVWLVFQIVYQNKWFDYPNTFIVIIATYTFGCLITAIFNVFSYRKLGSFAISAAKTIRLARALVAIFALQTAMLHTFGGEHFAPYRALFNALTGGGVCLLILAMALNMILHANKNLKLL